MNDPKSPAAAPAAETPSEPAAPAPPVDPCQRCGKFGGHVVVFRFDRASTAKWVCPHCLDAQEKRLETLEGVLRDLIAWASSTPVNAVTVSAWIHGVKFKPEDVAVWDEARAALGTSKPGGAGEGTT